VVSVSILTIGFKVRFNLVFIVQVLSIVVFMAEMGVMPEIAQAIEEMDWRFVCQSFHFCVHSVGY